MDIGNIHRLRNLIRRQSLGKTLSILSVVLGTLFLTVNCQEHPYQESCMDCDGFEKSYAVGQFDRLSINRLNRQPSADGYYVHNRIVIDLNTGAAKLYHDDFEVRTCAQSALTRLLLDNIDHIRFSETLRTDFFCTLDLKDEDVFSSGGLSVDARGCGSRYISSDGRELVDALYSAYWDNCQ